jgi:hypothetical protein
MFDQLVVDSTGEAFLCCAMPNHPALMGWTLPESEVKVEAP